MREDNAAISSLDSKAATLKDQIRKVQEMIEEAEQASRYMVYCMSDVPKANLSSRIT